MAAAIVVASFNVINLRVFTPLTPSNELFGVLRQVAALQSVFGCL